MPFASGSHTGRVTPRVTSSTTSFAPDRRPSIRCTPASRSSCRLAIDSASASQVVDTQFTHCPPWITPTEKVQSSVVIVLDGDDLLRHLADRAAPFGQARAGMRGPPGGLQVEARDGVAPGHHAAIGRAGSGTST